MLKLPLREVVIVESPDICSVRFRKIVVFVQVYSSPFWISNGNFVHILLSFFRLRLSLKPCSFTLVPRVRRTHGLLLERVGEHGVAGTIKSAGVGYGEHDLC